MHQITIAIHSVCHSDRFYHLWICWKKLSCLHCWLRKYYELERIESTQFTFCDGIWRHKSNTTITIVWISQQLALQLTIGLYCIFCRDIFYYWRRCWKNFICFAWLAVEVLCTRGNEICTFYTLWCCLKVLLEQYQYNSVNESTTTTPNGNEITSYFSQRYFLLLTEMMENLYLFCIVGCESNMD